MLQVSCGENHSAALGVGGEVYSWGRGKSGALGQGDFKSARIPGQVRALQGMPVVQVGGWVGARGSRRSRHGHTHRLFGERCRACLVGWVYFLAVGLRSVGLVVGFEVWRKHACFGAQAFSRLPAVASSPQSVTHLCCVLHGCRWPAAGTTPSP